MSKVNPLSIERQPAKSKEIAFSAGGVEFSVSFRGISDAALLRAMDDRDALFAKYEIGVGERGSKSFIQPVVLLGPGGIRCESSLAYWLVACGLSNAQITENESDHYTPEDWIMFMQNPDMAVLASEAFNSLVGLVGESVTPEENSTQP